MKIKHRIYHVLAAISLVIASGTVGYYILYGGRIRWMDCLYMTVISITSVGFGEVMTVTGNTASQIFTMVLITFGMGIILYGISSLTALLIEGELSGLLRKNKMRKRIEKLTGHYIVCGGGETGLPVLRELIQNREAAVLVERDEAKIAQCLNALPDLLLVEGDATDDENLVAAGIERAAGIAICLPSDNDNLYITMTSRMLNRRMRVITRMTNEKLRPKLIKAGADRMIAPDAIGALRIASELIRPTVVDFLDSMLRSGQGNLRIHQLDISAESKVAGRSIQEVGLGDRFNLLVIGARTAAGEIMFNPAPTAPLTPGMTLIVMGEVDNIAAARKTL